MSRLKTENVPVNVTAKDIRTGDRIYRDGEIHFGCNPCPVTLAIARKLKPGYVVIVQEGSALYYKYRDWRYVTTVAHPKAVLDWLLDYDARETGGDPAALTIPIPSVLLEKEAKT